MGGFFDCRLLETRKRAMSQSHVFTLTPPPTPCRWGDDWPANRTAEGRFSCSPPTPRRWKPRLVGSQSADSPHRERSFAVSLARTSRTLFGASWELAHQSGLPPTRGRWRAGWEHTGVRGLAGQSCFHRRGVSGEPNEYVITGKESLNPSKVSSAK